MWGLARDPANYRLAKRKNWWMIGGMGGILGTTQYLQGPRRGHFPVAWVRGLKDLKGLLLVLSSCFLALQDFARYTFYNLYSCVENSSLISK